MKFALVLLIFTKISHTVTLSHCQSKDYVMKFEAGGFGSGGWYVTCGGATLLYKTK